MTGHSNGVRCLLALGDTLWSGSDDHTIRIWPVSPVQERPDRVASLIAPRPATEQEEIVEGVERSEGVELGGRHSDRVAEISATEDALDLGGQRGPATWSFFEGTRTA